jgi:4-amino-4-deoxy-L-arabinose transferase-like glycosyltransferase
MTKEKRDAWISYGGLVLAVSIFLGFGLFHLTKFETVDEHFWKYERIPQYWQGIRDGFAGKGWKQTRINDKPGVTVALVSGIGLLWEPHPEEHRIRDKSATEDDAFTVYDVSRTERINMALRLPILLLGAFSLPVFFWLISVIVRAHEERNGSGAEEASRRARWTAVVAVLLIATSPVLVGMSQILNPDAMLWVFMPLALLSYFALLETGQRRFVWWCGVSTGLALLSKYTASILLPLYMLAFSGRFLFFREDVGEASRYFRRRLLELGGIVFLAVGAFSLLMPSVFQKPKHLFSGTLGSPALQSLLWPLAFTLGWMAVDAWLLQGRMTTWLTGRLARFRGLLTSGTALILLALFGSVFLNTALNGRWVPLDDLKEEAYVEGDLAFPMFAADPAPVRAAKEWMAETQSLPFSLTPFHLALILSGWSMLLLGRSRSYAFYHLFGGLLVLVFVGGALFSGIFLTYRYAIVLYPILSFVAALAALQAVRNLKNGKVEIAACIGILGVVTATGTYALWQSRPHYLNYSNALLPKEYSLTDSWGYGGYEAAQYLNGLPDAERLTVWSDRNGLCQFIVGKCIREYRIDLNKTVPDYFVFSRRGSIRHKFQWKDGSLARRSNLGYYEEDVLADPAWEFRIDGREKNWVKVVRSVEGKGK